MNDEVLTGTIVSEHAQQVDSTTSNPTATPVFGQVLRPFRAVWKSKARRFDAQWAVRCQPSHSQVPGKGHSNQLPRKSSIRRRMKNETHKGCQHRTLGLSWPGLDALSTPIRSSISAGMPDGRTSSSANSDAEKGQRCIAGQRV